MSEALARVLACAGCPYCGCKPCTGYAGHMRAQCSIHDTQCPACADRAPVLHPPCEQCGERQHHAPECEGEPRPETLAQALSRARKLADEQLRNRVRRYLEVTLPRQGSQPRGKFCPQCRESPRYPDHHCREHTAYLTGTRLEAERADSDPEAWLDVWRLFFERVDLLLKT